MRIKSYFASSVQAAMRQAHEDLGADAVLIESHATSAETAHLGQFEVVCGLAETPARKPARTKRAAASASTGQDELAAELKMLRSQMDELRSMLKPAPVVTSQMEAVRDELIAADIEPSIVAMLLESAVPRRGADSARQMIADALCARLRTASNRAGLQSEGGAGLQPANGASAPRSRSGNAIVFVGPPGAGKTTTLAKIAVKHCLGERRTVRIVSFDAERIGAHERLRAFASVLGIGFVAASSIAEFLDALKESRSKECVLIDTPGYSASDIEAARDLATVLERAAPRDVHLVLPACAKRADLAAFSDRFTLFQPTKLLFTKLDETASFGSIVSEAVRLDKPMSYFSTGQEVPEDLEEASADTLIRRVLPPETAATASAA